MNSALFRLERQNGVMIVIPTRNLSELEFAELERQAKGILSSLDIDDFAHVLIDFEQSGYFGSTALGFFVKLWKRVSSKNGRLATCNMTDSQREILQLTRLDSLWPDYPTRDEALEALRH